jgi:hypothetical protein
MTAALGLSPIDGPLISCTPSIHCISKSENLTSIRETATKLGKRTLEQAGTLSQGDHRDLGTDAQARTANEICENMSIHFQIALNYHHLTDDATPGSCWHYLFKHCLMVRGFPIRKRPKLSLGLEIPLNLVAELIDTKYLQEFDGHTFLKGYSAMLAPAERLDSLFVWHLCRSSTKDPISYLDHGMSHLYKIGPDDLVKCRHIVGWCYNIRNNCGAADSNYEVF